MVFLGLVEETLRQSIIKKINHGAFGDVHMGNLNSRGWTNRIDGKPSNPSPSRFQRFLISGFFARKPLKPLGSFREGDI